MKSLVIGLAWLATMMVGCQYRQHSSTTRWEYRPEPGPTPAPPPPKEETVISRLDGSAVEAVHACLKYNWQYAGDEWSQIGGSYLSLCLVKIAGLSNRDSTKQFEKDFTVLYRALHVSPAQPYLAVNGNDVVKKIRQGRKI